MTCFAVWGSTPGGKATGTLVPLGSKTCDASDRLLLPLLVAFSAWADFFPIVQKSTKACSTDRPAANGTARGLALQSTECTLEVSNAKKYRSEGSVCGIWHEVNVLARCADFAGTG